MMLVGASKPVWSHLDGNIDQLWGDGRETFLQEEESKIVGKLVATTNQSCDDVRRGIWVEVWKRGIKIKEDIS